MMHVNDLPAVFITAQDAAPAGFKTSSLASADFAVSQVIRRPSRVSVYLDRASHLLRLDRAGLSELLLERGLDRGPTRLLVPRLRTVEDHVGFMRHHRFQRFDVPLLNRVPEFFDRRPHILHRLCFHDPPPRLINSISPNHLSFLISPRL